MSKTANRSSKAIWLDCDPGHDDAIAILLAFYGKKGESDTIDVLGISTTHGNATGLHTYTNAIKLLTAYGIRPNQCKVWRGSDGPILRKGKVDKEIHGNDGLGGVECLPELKDERVQEHIQATLQGESGEGGMPPADPLRLVQYQISLLEERRLQGLPPISLIATGPLTNIALLIKLCPGDGSLLTETVEQIVLMGGSAGMSGNRSPLAEWNIYVDPEAASIVFDSKLKVVMAGLNVTHQAILTPSLHTLLLNNNNNNREEPSPIRRLTSSAITFFAETYASEFGFKHGPPIHDVLTVAYILDPNLFYSLEPRFNTPQMIDQISSNQPKRVQSKRFRVKIDTSPSDTTAGTTIVDFYQQWPIEHDGWHSGGRNAVVLEYVDTQRLWELLFDAVNRAEEALSR